MKRILLALDPHDASTDVLVRAIEMARSLNARIRLLSVLPLPLPSLLPGPAKGPVHLGSAIAIANAEADLLERSEHIPSELRDGLQVEEGAVADTVCAVARSYGADLVIIGAHRHGLLARVLGTTAAKIVDHVGCPILVMKPEPSPLEVSCRSGVLAGSLLKREHARLEQICRDLLAAYDDDDWQEVRAQWGVLEPELRSHMELEERVVLPELRRVDHAEAEALSTEHSELRQRLAALAVAVDLHALSRRDAEQLVARILSHGEREQLQLDARVETSRGGSSSIGHH